MAALLGDVVFTLARRLAIESVLEANSEVPIWSYLNSFNYVTGLERGTFHGADVLSFFYGFGFPATVQRTYFLNFLHNLDPNEGVGVGDEGLRSWPKWTENQQLLWVKALENDLLADNFRSESYNFMKQNIDALRF